MLEQEVQALAAKRAIAASAAAAPKPRTEAAIFGTGWVLLSVVSALCVVAPESGGEIALLRHKPDAGVPALLPTSSPAM